MSSGSAIPTLVVAPGGADAMHVERGATPDGRLLLYFTFEWPADARPDNGAGSGHVPDTPPADASH